MKPYTAGMTLEPGESTEVVTTWCGSGLAGEVLELRDISYEAFGKYQHCTKYGDYWYSHGDFDQWGKPNDGAVPDPNEHPNAKPYKRNLWTRIFS